MKKRLCQLGLKLKINKSNYGHVKVRKNKELVKYWFKKIWFANILSFKTILYLKKREFYTFMNEDKICKTCVVSIYLWNCWCYLIFHGEIKWKKLYLFQSFVVSDRPCFKNKYQTQIEKKQKLGYSLNNSNFSS